MWPISRLFPLRKPSAGKVARSVEELLEKQYKDARAKEEDDWHWGASGAWVRRATEDCERILRPLPEQDDLTGYFHRVMPLLAQLADSYCNNARDAEGFGLGTVREIEKAVEALYNSLDAGEKKTR